jgi:hypothetical protein
MEKVQGSSADRRGGLGSCLAQRHRKGLCEGVRHHHVEEVARIVDLHRLKVDPLRFAEAPAPLMWPRLVVFAHPPIEIDLQLVD